MPYKFNPFTSNLDYYQSGGSSSGVTGIPPTNIGAIARWADTTGTTIENSPDTNVQDSGAIEAQGFITQSNVTGIVTVNNGEAWIAPGLTIASGGGIILASGSALILV